MVKYSYIIPVFNAEAYIGECIDSICRDLKDNYEIILVDDGSSDRSGNLCDSYAEQNPNIKTIHQHNAGVAKARNRGLEEARGEFVIFIDSDDRIDAEKLRIVKSIIESDESIDMIVFGIRFDYYKYGKCYRRDNIVPAISGKYSINEVLQNTEQLFYSNSFSSMCNRIIRRKLLLENDLKYSEQMFFYEDLELAVRCFAKCRFVYFSPEIIYLYRQTEDEGNDGRRLMRIPHLNVLADQIYAALNQFTLIENSELIHYQLDQILMVLYLMWMREKMAVCSVAEIQVIQEDFASWMKSHELYLRKEIYESADQIVKSSPYKILSRKYLMKFRHRIAVFLKYIGVLNT